MSRERLSPSDPLVDRLRPGDLAGDAGRGPCVRAVRRASAPATSASSSARSSGARSRSRWSPPSGPSSARRAGARRASPPSCCSPSSPTGAITAGFHAGRRDEVVGPAGACARPAARAADLEGLTSLALGTGPAVRIAMCDAVAWSFLGISMAGWNALISAALGRVQPARRQEAQGCPSPSKLSHAARTPLPRPGRGAMRARMAEILRVDHAGEYRGGQDLSRPAGRVRRACAARKPSPPTWPR